MAKKTVPLSLDRSISLPVATARSFKIHEAAMGLRLSNYRLRERDLVERSSISRMVAAISPNPRQIPT